MLHDRRSAIEGEFATDNLAGDTVEAQIRKRILKRIQKRNAFYVHLLGFLVINAMLWSIWATTGAGYAWPIFITAGWGIGLVAIAVQVYQESPQAAAQRELEIQREVEQEKRRMGNPT